MCGSAMRLARSTLVSLSGHVHVLLDLKGDLRKKRGKLRGEWTHTQERRLIYALVC